MTPSTLNPAQSVLARPVVEKMKTALPAALGQKIIQELSLQAAVAIGPAWLQANIQDLATESDETLRFQALLHLAQSLKFGPHEEIAQWLYLRLAAVDTPDWVQRKAQDEKSAWTGGKLGIRAEYLLSRFCKDATDARIIAPMMGASLIGRLAGTMVWGRFSAVATRGWSVRLAAGTAGYLAEASAFAGLGRALSPYPNGPFSEDLARSFLSLGALRLFGSVGSSGARFLTAAGKAPGVPALMTSQLSGLFGLMAAHGLEERLGLRPKVDGSTRFIDSFAALVSLGVGTRLGRSLAGEGFHRLQRDLEIRAHSISSPRAEILSQSFEFGLRRPAMAGRSLSKPWLMMSSNSNDGNGGGKKSDSLSPVEVPSIVVDPALYGDPYLGQVLHGRYKIEAVLGRGGGGKVYLATHEILGKKVAIKVLHEKMAGDDEATERFLNEAKAVTAIGNPHIVDVSDFGEMPDGSAYYVMEHLEGVPLSHLLKGDQPIEVPRLLRLARQVAEGLGAAHQKGIVHRDLKPDNVFLIQQGSEADFVKILDFGIAKILGNQRRLTRMGITMGTPHYMSPEQALGHPVDPRSDVYSLGILLYEMASGKVPFEAGDNIGLMTQHVANDPPPLRGAVSPEIPPALEALILKCLAKRPEDRFQSMEEVMGELDKISLPASPQTPREPTPPRRISTTQTNLVPARSAWPRYVGLGGTLGLAALAVAIFATRRSPSATPPDASPADAATLPDAPEQAPTVKPLPIPEKANVTLEVVPTDAHVFHKGKDLGQQPLQIDVELGAPIVIEFRRSGYKAKKRVLDGTEAKVSVRLDPEPPAKKTPVRIQRPKPPREKPKPPKDDGIVSPWK